MALTATEAVLKVPFAIAAGFRERIATGELLPGELLPVENELAQQLEVSKATVREAMRILENEGLIEVVRGIGGGPRVLHPSIDQTARAMGVYLQIGDVRVLDVWESRDRIIGGAVERLAGVASSAGSQLIEGHARALKQLTGSHGEFLIRLSQIGEDTVRAAGNATDVVLVAALRHVVAAEFELATTWALEQGPRKAALVRNMHAQLAGHWLDVAEHTRRGHTTAARAAYDAQATKVREGLAMIIPDTTVVDVVSARPLPRAAPTRRGQPPP